MLARAREADPLSDHWTRAYVAERAPGVHPVFAEEDETVRNPAF
ncbi:MAG TPA: hypothetical protein VIU81_13445 [Gaiellaceae bacterium]